MSKDTIGLFMKRSGKATNDLGEKNYKVVLQQKYLARLFSEIALQLCLIMPT